MEIKDMLHIDLLAKYNANDYHTDYEAEFKNWAEKHNRTIAQENKTIGLKAGDVVEFTSGHNDNIRYKTRILGFDLKDGEAYMLWDCYWFTVDLVKRNYTQE